MGHYGELPRCLQQRYPKPTKGHAHRYVVDVSLDSELKGMAVIVASACDERLLAVWLLWKRCIDTTRARADNEHIMESRTTWQWNWKVVGVYEREESRAERTDADIGRVRNMLEFCRKVLIVG